MAVPTKSKHIEIIAAQCQPSRTRLVNCQRLLTDANVS